MNKKIRVTGNVQGVFFRKCTQQKALELGIKGWVKNEPDGSVLTEIEGEFYAVMAMEEWLKKGPPNAKVNALWVEEGEKQGYADFSILY
jgi:acylphosphatase